MISAFALAVGTRIAGLAAMNALTISASAVLLVYGVPFMAIVAAAWAANTQLSSGRLSEWVGNLGARIRPLIAALPLPGSAGSAARGGAS